jgi:hypothetical protein
MKLHELTDLAHKVWGDRPGDETPFFADLERFAALVAAAEREAIAQKFDGPVWSYDYREIAAAIRARGQE